jgi:hypothetical protein
VETTGSLKSHHTTAFVELSSAVHSKLSVVGVSDVPTDRGRLRCLNPPNDLSLERILSATKRLFMDSEVASSRLGLDGREVAVLARGRAFPPRLDRTNRGR